MFKVSRVLDIGKVLITPKYKKVLKIFTLLEED